jgi:hypothetical protein
LRNVTKGGSASRSPFRTILLRLFPILFPRTLPCQSFLYPALCSGFQVKGVTFHFLNNVFGLNLALEPPQGTLDRFAFLQSNFCQDPSPPNRNNVLLELTRFVGSSEALNRKLLGERATNGLSAANYGATEFLADKRQFPASHPPGSWQGYSPPQWRVRQ